MTKKIVVGISHGDINSISYEIIIKSLLDNRITDVCVPIVYGSPKVAAYHRKALNIENFNFNSIRVASEANSNSLNLINVLDDNVRVELGKTTKMAGESSILAIDRVIDDVKNNHLDAMVTAPISKENVQQVGFNFAGHTDYLKKKFDAEDVLMLMVYQNIRIGVVTTHIPIKDVSSALSEDLILSKLRIIDKSLLRDFAIRKGKIAVLGLNPHAGDHGVIGSEDDDIIKKAIDKAREEGIFAVGPFPADGFFGSGGYTQYDAVLAMYHDQGLIPFKVLSQGEGVNYTAGLPVVRTSPGHGTAFDIVGKDLANPASMRNSIYMAVDIARNRMLYDENAKNPLKKQKFEYGGRDVDIAELESQLPEIED